MDEHERFMAYYNRDADTLYISLAPIEYVDSVELAPGLFVKYDAGGNVVGVKLVDLQEIMKEPRGKFLRWLRSK